MLINNLFKQTTLLEKTLDASWLRNEVISNNIANVDTPRYKKKSVEFEETLSKYIKENKGITLDELAKIQPKIVDGNKNLKMRIDENNVDIDVEMAQLAKNQILYNAMLQQVSKDFGRMRMVLK